MNDLRDEKVKRLERRLLKASRVSPEELREIVSAPQLLDKINARIRIAQEAVQSPDIASGRRGRFSVWGLPKIGFAAGGLAVFLAAALGLLFFLKTDFSASQLTESVAAPEIERPSAFAPKPEIDERRKTENPAGENRNISKKIALKNKLSSSARRMSGMNPGRQLVRPARSQPEEAFYPLAFAENLEEAKEAGQVIRVELSRSSLLALGVNPPTDGENLKVRTDLLIGADGVAQGIRFVK
jgi:hypothetical protein